MDEKDLFDQRGITIAGRPVAWIPTSAQKYKNFREWWFVVGRLKPEDPQGWRTISGPWVMEGRIEAIPPAEWDALPKAEQELISSWAENLPIGALYD